jgi:cytochrome c peroxidase
LTRLFVTDMAAVVDGTVGCKPDGTSGPCLPPMTSIIDMTSGSTPLIGCQADTRDMGQPIAVAFAGDGSTVVQSREPAMLALADGTTIGLATADSRADTGHLLFHANAGGFMACASCHLEGDDDGRVWNFDCGATATVASGPRRTQSLQTGVAGTQPYHWNGDEADFTQLMTDVFLGRMSGPKVLPDQMNAMVSWIDGQPRRMRAPPANPAAVARGAALFNDAQNVGCVTCHSGTRFSSNLTVDVGTGRAFQVPSLLGIGTRGPFMHDGCAATLRDRFNPACGGDRHGITANLSPTQIDDLIAYLDSL